VKLELVASGHPAAAAGPPQWPQSCLLLLLLLLLLVDRLLSPFCVYVLAV
jgi:hypothetical protein